MKLIYVMDPLCGWCYGNGANIQKLYEKYKDVLDFEILPAGMWTGANARSQSKPMAQYFKKHDLQIQHATGTAFGEGYFELIENENIILDSEKPSRAIVTIKKLWPEKAVSFTSQVQKARYWHGKDLNLDQTYLIICDELKIERKAFIEAYHSEFIKKTTLDTFELSRQYAYSYPTLLLEKQNKEFIIEQGFAGFESLAESIDDLLN